MAEDSRRFDDLVRTVAEMRRRQEDTRSTVLARLGSLTPGGGGGGVTDHGALTGLGDDDHPQYHNDARGDARYRRVNTVVAVTNPNFFDLGMSTKAAADSANRWEVFTDGYQKWGTGAAALDTVLYRQGVGHLRTDGRFEAATMTVGGTDLATQLSGKVATGDARVTADQAAGTASIRTLGTGAVQAAAGNHTHDVTALTSSANREARYYLNVAQTVAAAGDRRVYFDASEYTSSDIAQTLGDAATGSMFTLNRSGVYSLAANVRVLAGGTAAAERLMTISEGTTAGTVRYASSGLAPGGATPSTLTCSTEVRFTSGATVAVWVYQNSGATLSLDTAWRGTNFSITWLRP